MPHSSPASAPRLFAPEPSLYVNIWWGLVHTLLAATVLLLDLHSVLALLGLALVAAHGILRFPRAPRLLLLNSDSTWDVPEQSAHGLCLAPGTAWTTWYVELVLSGSTDLRIVLLKDQLGAEDWRALELAVREHDDTGSPSIPPRS